VEEYDLVVDVQPHLPLQHRLKEICCRDDAATATASTNNLNVHVLRTWLTASQVTCIFQAHSDGFAAKNTSCMIKTKEDHKMHSAEQNLNPVSDLSYA